MENINKRAIKMINIRKILTQKKEDFKTLTTVLIIGSEFLQTKQSNLDKLKLGW